MFITLIISVIVFDINKQFKKEISHTKSSIRNVRKDDLIKNNFAPESETNASKKVDIRYEESNKVKIDQETKNDEKAPQLILAKDKKLHLKDSVESETKKVIIVKKIIQRDTIFIEREN